MSLAIQRSKYTGDRMNYQGDPGLGSFFKGVAKVGLGLAGMIPGVGTVAQMASAAFFPPAPGTTTYAQPPLSFTTMPARPTQGPGGVGMDCSGNWSDVAARYGRSVGSVQAMCAGQPQRGFRVDPLAAFPGGEPLFSPLAAPTVMNGAGMPAAMVAGKPSGVPGYHWNKSGYFLQSGQYVAPGTKMVKNRRRNPANPRATSNAITRIRGAKRYAKALSAISIRKKC